MRSRAVLIFSRGFSFLVCIAFPLHVSLSLTRSLYSLLLPLEYFLQRSLTKRSESLLFLYSSSSLSHSTWSLRAPPSVLVVHERSSDVAGSLDMIVERIFLFSYLFSLERLSRSESWRGKDAGAGAVIWESKTKNLGFRRRSVFLKCFSLPAFAQWEFHWQSGCARSSADSHNLLTSFISTGGEFLSYWEPVDDFLYSRRSPLQNWKFSCVGNLPIGGNLPTDGKFVFSACSIGVSNFVSDTRSWFRRRHVAPPIL